MAGGMGWSVRYANDVLCICYAAWLLWWCCTWFVVVCGSIAGMVCVVALLLVSHAVRACACPLADSSV